MWFRQCDKAWGMELKLLGDKDDLKDKSHSTLEGMKMFIWSLK